MKKILVVVLVAFCFGGYAQAQGMAFSQNLEWSNLQKKAQREGKYIFVDCYATWCGPCKLMDKLVYVDETVGKFMNDNFLCVKLQMDSTSEDNDIVKKWFPTARAFEKLYGIHSYPAYLFFSPDGKIVHKDGGSKSIKAFLGLARTALDTGQQYYTLLARYEKEEYDPVLLRTLAIQAAKLKQDSLGEKIAFLYIHDFLEKLPEDQIWTKENIEFFVNYCLSDIVDANGYLFRSFYKDRKFVDSVMGQPGYSDFWILSVIYQQEVRPHLKAAMQQNTEPNWIDIRNLVRRNFGRDEAEKDIVIWQTKFYKSTKYWNKYVHYLIKSCKQQGNSFMGDAWRMNNAAFEIFKYSKSRKQLRMALSWANKSVDMTNVNNHGLAASYMDTKANLLYKLGKNQEALTMELHCANLDPEDNEIQENLVKMKTGKPTWVL